MRWSDLRAELGAVALDDDDAGRRRWCVHPALHGAPTAPPVIVLLAREVDVDATRIDAIVRRHFAVGRRASLPRRQPAALTIHVSARRYVDGPAPATARLLRVDAELLALLDLAIFDPEHVGELVHGLADTDRH